MIPKVIFQTHENAYEDLPIFIKEMMQTWVIMNPGYKHVYFNSLQRREYVKNSYPNILDAYDQLEKKFQADIWRYLILYNNGGFYSDIDSICWHSIDYFLEKKYNNEDVIALNKMSVPKQINFEYLKNEYVNNCNFACKPKSEIIKKVLDAAINCTLNKSLTPGVFSEIILDNKNDVLFELNNIVDNNDLYNFGQGRFFENDIYVKYLGVDTTYKTVLKNYYLIKRLG